MKLTRLKKSQPVFLVFGHRQAGYFEAVYSSPSISLSLFFSIRNNTLMIFYSQEWVRCPHPYQLNKKDANETHRVPVAKQTLNGSGLATYDFTIPGETFFLWFQIGTEVAQRSTIMLIFFFFCYLIVIGQFYNPFL